MANAGKYTTTFFVVIFSTLYHSYEANLDPEEAHYPFFYTWIVFSFISSIYAYVWDIKMDWGLFDSNAGDNRFLREEIVYSNVVRCPITSSFDYIILNNFFVNRHTTTLAL